MRIKETQPYHALYSALFFAVVATCGVVGSRFLIWLAPWREVEIYLTATLAFVVAAALWFVGRPKRWVRLSLLVGALLLMVGFAFGNYQVFLDHYRIELPRVSEYVDVSNQSADGVGEASMPQDKLISLVKNAPGVRSRLLALMNAPVGDDDLLAEAEQFLKHRYQYYAYDPAQLTQDLTWTEDPYGDRSWNWRLHNMGYVATLARAYEATGKAAYLQRAEDLILDWISDNTLYVFNPPSEFSWNDHSTAFRLVNWLYFFDIWKSSELATEENIEVVLRSLIGHALMLSDAGFYTQNHNHGIDQDRALLAFTVMLPYIVKSEQWKELALARLFEQVRFAVSPGGIHLEHSPAYHLYGMRQLQKTLAFLDLWNVQHHVVDEMTQNLSAMVEFVPNIVKPDGSLAQIGDTGSELITDYREQLSSLEEISPLLKELVQTGSSQYAADMAQGFQEEGYALIRDFEGGRRRFQDSMYLFFTAGAHEGRGHRQADDLSFVLSHGGQEILVDPGYYSYKKDAGRDYVVSAPAHNTVVLDGASYKGWDTTLDTFVTNDQYTLVHGSHRNYPGFEHVRWLLYIRPRLAIVVDRMQSVDGTSAVDARHFEQVFHFSPDLSVEVDRDKNEVTVFPGRSERQPVLLVTQLGDRQATMRVAMGEESPMQGWHSPAHAQLVPAPTLISGLGGSRAEYVTAMQMPTDGQTLQEMQNTGRSFRAAIEEEVLTVNWIDGTEAHNLKLDLKTNKVLVN